MNQTQTVTRTDTSFFGCLALYLYTFYYNLNATNYTSIWSPNVFRLLWMAVIACLVLKVLLMDSYRLRQILVWLILLGTTLLVSKRIGSNRLFLQMSLVLFLYGIPFRKIVSHLFTATVLVLLFVCGSMQAGILQNYEFNHGSGTRVLIARGMGFNYYSRFAYLCLGLTFLYLYLRGKRCTYVEIALLAAAHVLLYRYVHTTNLVVLTACGLLVLYLIAVRWQWLRFRGRIWKWIALLLPWLAFGGTWLMVWTYDHKTQLFDPFRNSFDTLISRLDFSVTAYHQYGIRLFGNHVTLQGNRYVNFKTMSGGLYIDSNYVYLPVVYGAVFTVLFLGLLSALGLWIWKKREPYLYLWFCVIVLISVVNNFLLFFFCDALVLLAGDMICGSQEKESGEARGHSEGKN